MNGALQHAFEANAFQAIAISCPTCRANVGAPCVRPSGHQASDIHRERKQLADQEFIATYGLRAVIGYDEARGCWGVRSSTTGPFVAHAMFAGRKADGVRAAA